MTAEAINKENESAAEVPETNWDPSRGVAPILEGRGTVQINGQEYKLRKLGVTDYPLLAIISHKVRKSGEFDFDFSDFKDLDFVNDEARIRFIKRAYQVFELALVYAPEELMKLFALVIGVRREELNDRQRFPWSTVLDLLASLVPHIDVQSFLSTPAPTEETATETPSSAPLG